MKNRLFSACLAAAAALLFLAGGPQVARSADLTGQLEIFSWWAGDEGPAL